MVIKPHMIVWVIFPCELLVSGLALIVDMLLAVKCEEIQDATFLAAVYIYLDTFNLVIYVLLLLNNQNKTVY